MQYEQKPIISQPPRRRKRTKLQIFKEAYLPTIILAITIVLVLVFIIGGAINRGLSDETLPPETTTAPTPSTEDPQMQLWAQEAANLIIRADMQACNYDFEAAIETLDSFSGDASRFPSLGEARSRYQNILDNMVSWSAKDVPNLSFNVLIADPKRAFNDDIYGSSYKKNFVTIDEFAAILQQLYDNGYVLVDLDTFYATEYSASSGQDVFTEVQILLPEGKKPLMLTETNANYYYYMVDSNGDGKPDAKADGFASKLCYDGEFYNELVNADGSISTGAFDLVPILEAFIEANPDFSYKGARATIACSGYDGILGHRVNSTNLSAAKLQEERDNAAAVVQALRDTGYTLACYTYGNVKYTTMDAAEIRSDLQKWDKEIAPWIGNVDVLVFARNGEIGDTSEYTGSKFNVVYNSGFRYFIGSGETPWNQVTDLYIRHNRINVTGNALKNSADLFTGMFDASTVLDSQRP